MFERNYFVHALLLVLVVLMLATAASAFDIAVYYDTHSNLNWVAQKPSCSLSRQEGRWWMFQHITNDGEAIRWLRDMGTTHLIVYYPFDEFADSGYDRDFTRTDLTDNIGDMKLLNASWPGETFKYIYSQCREVYVGDSANPWVNRYCWGEHTAEISHINEPVLACGPSWGEASAQPHDMWRPCGDMGNWEGWDSREGWISGNIYMPWHIRILCDAMRNGGNATDTLCSLYWYMQASINNNEHYWQYPPIYVRLDSLSNPGAQFDTLNYVLSSEHRPFTYGQITGGEFVPETTYADTSVFFSMEHRKVNMRIHYHGTHDFYLREVDIFDDGYWKLWVSPSEMLTTKNHIISKFSEQYHVYSSGHLAGWYYDEWAGYPGFPMAPMIPSLVKVAGILEQAGLPTFCVNGLPGTLENSHEGRNQLFSEMDRQHVDMPVQMTEMYFQGYCDTLCVYGPYPLGALAASMSSDTDYIHMNAYQDTNNVWCYYGPKSLQCALDLVLWGARPIDQIQHLPGLDPSPSDTLELFEGSAMTIQVEQAHRHGNKLWPMLLASKDMKLEWNGVQGSETVRGPTPNEIKLAAWLAVSCDGDGILYYPMNGVGAQMLEWGDTTNLYGRGLCNATDSVHRTDRYFAAAHVDSEILKIAPEFEPLQYMRTYASRAFERNYGSSETDSWVRKDHLHGNSLVDSIWTEKLGLPQDSWNPEGANATYVQVSRFNSHSLNAEDYWFLIVNRRALTNEKRQVHLRISQVEHPTFAYAVEKRIAGTTMFADTGSSTQERDIVVQLDPGEAEFVHFYLADTTDMVITTSDTLYAPVMLAKNIVVADGGALYILPNAAALRDTIHDGDSAGVRYDSIATISFWPGRGICVKSGDHPRALHIWGNDSIRIKLQSARTDQFWSGIDIKESPETDVDLRYIDVSNTKCGLNLLCGDLARIDTPYVKLRNCLIHNCTYGILASPMTYVSLAQSRIVTNTHGIGCSTGSVLRLDSTDVNDNAQYGIFLEGATGLFTAAKIMSNSGNGRYNDSLRVLGGLCAYDSRVSLRCCKIEGNAGPGISEYNSNIIMTEASSQPRWGYNILQGNRQNTLQVDAVSGYLAFDWGQNGIRGDTTGTTTWINWTSSHQRFVHWRRNYWGSTENLSIIRHFDVSDIIATPDVGYALAQEPSCGINATEPLDSGCHRDFALGRKYVDEGRYADARSIFQDLIADTDPCGLTGPSLRELLGVDLLTGESGDQTHYYENLADSSQNSGLRSEARWAQAWSLAYAGHVDSAKTIMESLQDSAKSDTAMLEVRIALASLELLRQSVDTTENLTTEECVSTLDSMVYWVGLLFAWEHSQLNVETATPLTARHTCDSVACTGRIYMQGHMNELPGDTLAEVGFAYRLMLDSSNWTRYHSTTWNSDSLYHWQVPVGRMGGLINYIFWARDAHGRFATSPMGANTSDPDSGATHFLSVEIGADTIHYADSVVIWAPATITHDIYVEDGGVLVFRPYPGAEEHTVRVGDSVLIWAENWSDTVDENDPADYSKIFILGTEQEPITFAPLITSSEDNSAVWGGFALNSFSNFFAKHAIFRSSVWALNSCGPTYVNDPNHPGIAIDSCWFDSSLTTLYLYGYFFADTTSYIRHTEFSHLGAQTNEFIYGGLMICEWQIQMSDCRIHDNAHEGLILENAGNSTFERVKVDHNHGPGLIKIYGTGDTRFSCCEFSFNGDTLPEALGYVGGRLDFDNQSNCVFMDSVGPLLKPQADHLNLHDGGNGLFLAGGTGKYVICASPWCSSVRDITGNYWYPVGPDSSAFLSFLTPDSAQYWNHSTHLDSFAACESMEASLPTVMAPRMGAGDDDSPTSSVNSGPTMATISRLIIEHVQAQQDLKQAQDWEKAGNHIAATSKFRSLLSKPTTEDIAAEALSGSFMSARRSGVKTGLSSFYAALRQQLPTDELQRQAHWLELKCLELEGQPQRALRGYEEIISRPDSRGDSVAAILSAMRLHCVRALQKKTDLASDYPQHRVTNLPELARRSFKLVGTLYGDDKLAGTKPNAVPIPQTYKLYQNYPNPFNPVTEIQFDLPEKTRVELSIFNILGQRVTTLVDEVRTAGTYQILWDGKSAGGVPVSSGMYIYQLKCGKFVDAKKMILLR